MNGIQILNVGPVYANMLPGWFIALLGIMAIILGFTALTLSSAGKGKPANICYIGYWIFIALIIFGGQHRPESEYIKYEVTIDDSVSFNKFYNQYEILEQRGEIYVVRERESND